MIRYFYIAILIVAAAVFILLTQKRDDMAAVSADGQAQIKLTIDTEYTPPNGSISILLKEIEYDSKKCELQYKAEDEKMRAWLPEGSFDSSGWWGTHGLFVDKIAEDSVIITIRYVVTDD